MGRRLAAREEDVVCRRQRTRCGPKMWNRGPTGCPGCDAGSAVTGASAWRTSRCGMAARAVACASTATSGGYLSSRWVRERPASLAIYCKACPVRNGTRFPKTAFTFDRLRQRIRCPAACWPLQGRRARYRGSRKNLFDLRRCAVVDNLHVLRRLAADTIQTA